MSLIDTEDNPVPADAVCGYVTTPDQIKVRYARWQALGKERRGTVTILQGRAEFIEKYFEVVSELRERGFSVVTFDWRGQGGSDRLTENPRCGHILDFEDFRIDLRTVLKEVSLASYSGPHFALAHSTGGLVLLSDTHRLRTMLDRALITSPLLGLPPDPRVSSFFIKMGTWLRLVTFGLWGRKPLRATQPTGRSLAETIGFPLARFCTYVSLGQRFVPGGDGTLTSPFEGNRLTSDKTRYERANRIVEEHPEIGVGSPTIGWLNAAGRTMMALRCREAGPNVKLPCLILGAGEDRIVSTPTTEDFVSRTKAAAFIEIPGAAHELMMEADAYREQFWAAFDAFLPGLEAEQQLNLRDPSDASPIERPLI